MKTRSLRFLQAIALALGAMALSACTLAPPKPRQFVMDDATRNGVLMLSMTYDVFSGYTIHYRGVDNPGLRGYLEAGEGLMLLPIKPAGDFQEYGLEGEIVAAELPAGRYHLYGFGMQSGAIRGSTDNDSGLIVQIIPSAVTYAGNFHFAATGRLGLTVTSARVDLADHFARDKKEFSYKFLGVESMPVLRGIPDGLKVSNISGISGRLDFGVMLTQYLILN